LNPGREALAPHFRSFRRRPRACPPTSGITETCTLSASSRPVSDEIDRQCCTFTSHTQRSSLSASLRKCILPGHSGWVQGFESPLADVIKPPQLRYMEVVFSRCAEEHMRFAPQKSSVHPAYRNEEDEEQYERPES
jgi:hypothetical protein